MTKQVTIPVDSSRMAVDSDMLGKWEQEDVLEDLRSRFVTGDWGKSNNNRDAWYSKDCSAVYFGGGPLYK